MKKGYATNAEQEAALKKYGLKDSAIYRQGRGREDWGNWKLRRGDVLCISGGLSIFGRKHREMARAVEAVQEWGAEILDIETGQRTGDGKGAQMISAALSRLHGDQRAMSKRAREMQAAAVKSRNKKVPRMSKREALKIWRDPELKLHEKLALMEGWSRARAYNELGATGVPSGRRPKESK